MDAAAGPVRRVLRQRAVLDGHCIQVVEDRAALVRSICREHSVRNGYRAGAVEAAAAVCRVSRHRAVGDAHRAKVVVDSTTLAYCGIPQERTVYYSQRSTGLVFYPAAGKRGRIPRQSAASHCRYAASRVADGAAPLCRIPRQGAVGNN